VSKMTARTTALLGILVMPLILAYQFGVLALVYSSVSVPEALLVPVYFLGALAFLFTVFIVGRRLVGEQRWGYLAAASVVWAVGGLLLFMMILVPG